MKSGRRVDIIAQVDTKEAGRLGGKRRAKNMTPEERSARAKKASLAAAKKRTAARLARERQAKRK